jgi:hypothetical protein
MSKTIFHIAPHGPGLNVGNFAISIAIRSLLRETNKDINILSIDAFSNKKLSGLNKQVIHEANLYGSGILVGGGNLYENNELIVDRNAIKSLQVPLGLFSISIGRIFNNNLKLARRTDVMPDETIQDLNKACSFSLSRDLATHNYLKSINSKKSQLGLCPTLFLNDYFEVKQKLNNLGRNDILLVIRNPELMNIPVKYKLKVAEFIKKTYDNFKKNKKNVKIVCNDMRDIIFVTSIGISDYIYTGEVDEYLTRLKNASLVISLRLHATLPCFSFVTKCINLSYDERSMSLMNSIGLKNWDIQILKEKNLHQILLKKIEQTNKFNSLQISFKQKVEKYKKIQLNALKIFS